MSQAISIIGKIGLFTLIPLGMPMAHAAGDTATDGTLGAAVNLGSGSFTVPQTLGTTVGNNLFHSFATFNVNAGKTATFTGDAALQNVISRVTGGSASDIDGTLRSQVGNADFYLINPAGVAFGPGAQVDVPAAFHVSTANKIGFPDGKTFYADPNQTSTLSAEAPASFGFLGTSAANNGLIQVGGAQLAVQEGKSLDVAAGRVTVENGATLSAPAGEIRLAAMQDKGTVGLERNADGNLPLPEAGPTASNAGEIKITNSTVTTTGDGGGRLTLWGGDSVFNKSKLSANNDGVLNAGSGKGIEVNVRSLTMSDHTLISSDSLAKSGKAGDVHLTAGTLDILNGSQITADTYSTANGSNISVAADSLKIDGQGSIYPTGILADAMLGSSGNAGSIGVNARTLNILYSGALPHNDSIDGLKNLSSGISSYTYADGNAANIKVNAHELNIAGQGSPKEIVGIYAFSPGISSETASKSLGNAGNVSVTADRLSIRNSAYISSSTASSGNGGSVDVEANDLTINGENSLYLTTIYSITAGGTGDAGRVHVKANNLNLLNAGTILGDSYGTSGLLPGQDISGGKAADIAVDASHIKIDRQRSPWWTGILSEAVFGSTSKAGVVKIDTKTLEILNGGRISSATVNGDGGLFPSPINSNGNAGDVIIHALDSIYLSGVSITFSTKAGDKPASQETSITSSTAGAGRAGSITIQAPRLTIINGAAVSAAAKAGSSGQTGDINIIAQEGIHLNHGRISLKNDARVSKNTAAAITPGSITVTAPDIDLRNGQITTNSTGNIAAGNIVVNFSHWLTMDPSLIATTANTGNGGRITINGGELIYLQNSGFITSVSGANGNGGNIAVNAGMLVMDSGIIQANAVGGSGGDIALNVDTLIPSSNVLLLGGTTPIDWRPFSGLNVIQAASQAGTSGNVTSSAPQLNLSGVLANLGGTQFDTSAIDQGYCELGTGSSLVRKGRGGLPVKGGDLLVF